MHDSKIVGLLKNLDAKEFRLLYKYLKSPFFNYSASITALYEYLRKFHPAFDHPSLDRRKLYGKLFPGETYDDKKMRNLLHEFYSHLERFLVQLHIRQTSFIEKKLLIRALEQRGPYELFTNKNRELVEDLANRPYRDIQTYLELLQLEESYYFHPATNKLDSGEKSLNDILRNLDNYFIANKLRLANEVQSRQKVVRQDIPLKFVNEVLEEVDDGGNDMIQFYSLLYQLNTTEAEDLFFKLKKQFFDHLYALSFNDQQVILFQLLNYAIRNGNRGRNVFFKEAFDLYWFGLENEILFENGKLTDSTYTNIVFLGGKLGLIEKIETFIRENSDYLDARVRNDAKNLAMANLLYLKKAYSEIDELIGNVRFESIFYQVRARSILLRALYESFAQDDSYYDLLKARIKAFEKFMRRNDSFSELQRKNYLAFTKFLNTLIKVKLIPVNRDELQSLKNKILKNDLVPNKQWLLDQL